MNKKFFISFILSLIFIAYIFNVDKIVSHKLSALNINIKSFYLSNLSTIVDSISIHFDQSEQLIQLKHQVSQNEKFKLLYLKDKSKTEFLSDDSLESVKVISYLDFNDFSKVLLTKPKKMVNNISALITEDGYSAGIMIQNESDNIGLLNNNAKSNYAVYIGKNEVPGITHGDYPQEHILIKYVPIWEDIKINDEVITSGMDNIFYKGVKVGYVVEIKNLATTKEVTVKPYANVYSQKAFYLYSKEIEELDSTNNEP